MRWYNMCPDVQEIWQDIYCNVINVWSVKFQGPMMLFTWLWSAITINFLEISQAISY